MNRNLPPERDSQKSGAKKVLKMILGILALELFFALFRQGAAWFHGQPLPWG